MPDRVILCIGTKKGLFVAEAAKTRRGFALRGPFGTGVAVYSALIDTRGNPRLYASSCNAFFGMKVLLLDRSRQEVQGDEVGPGLPEGGRASARQHLVARSRATTRTTSGAASSRPSLFRSSDGGDSWEMVPGISNHEHARKWHPGNGGLCMHTILRDGKRVHLGISTGGHYLSEDGGQTFTGVQPGRRRRLRARSLPRVRPVRSQDRRPQGRARPALHAEPRRLGRWTGPAAGHRRAAQRRPRPHLAVDRKGLPSDFGFPIVVHPHDPDTVYVMPLEGPTRTCPGGAPAVWRSENGGDSWHRLARGFPKKESYFTVQRDAMDIDDLKSPALYFGTTTGQLWMGRDGGEEWSCLFDSLPPIHCVKVAVV